MKLSSNKPYLLRAIYEWIVDNDATPYIMLFAESPDVLVPERFIDDGKIILNISPSAIQDLLIDNDSISFSARFGGNPFNIFAPIGAVLALYASENGEGLSFDYEPEDDTPPDEPNPPNNKSPQDKPSKKKSERPALKVVK